MYEKILEWGVNTLTSSALEKGKHEQNLILEAIKTKNILIVKRFEYAWTNCTELMEIFIEQDIKYRKCESDLKSNHNGKLSSEELLKVIKNELHPPFFGKLSHYRGRFEATNELLSSYTIEIFNALSFATFENLVREYKEKRNKDNASLSDIRFIYTNLLNLSLSSLSSLLRISSNDLRFWASEISYNEICDKFAKEDIKKMCEYIVSTTGPEIFFLSIEREVGLEDLWKEVSKQRTKRKIQKNSLLK